MWKKNSPGDNPVCIVGAGFQLAVLDRKRPSTGDIISKTVDERPSEFPALNRLCPLLTNRNLNYVWTNIYTIGENWQRLTPDIVAAYKTNFPNTRMGWLVGDIEQRNRNSYPGLLSLILGVELKRMLAFQYDQAELCLTTAFPGDLKDFLSASKKHICWVSLNYDMCLEKALDTFVGKFEWRYGFQELFSGDDEKSSSNICHVVVKPHGSLNIWFKTVWNSRCRPTEPDLHELLFVDKSDRLKSCAFKEIGYVSSGKPCEEVRPWIIGYLPDFMKDELNSPGNFADSAHDLCKWNLTYGALALQKASSLYILAYSMPEEDRWIWERLRALPKKAFPVYVASAGDTKRIVKSLSEYGFDANELTDNGFI